MKTPIKYIGHRKSYRDGACGSSLVFKQGETLMVDDEFASKMLRHPSVYVPGDDGVEAGETRSVVVNNHVHDENQDQEMRDAIQLMDKNSLAEYAKTHFNVSLDKRSGIESLRSQVVGLFDQYGTE